MNKMAWDNLYDNNEIGLLFSILYNTNEEKYKKIYSDVATVFKIYLNKELKEPNFHTRKLTPLKEINLINKENYKINTCTLINLICLELSFPKTKNYLFSNELKDINQIYTKDNNVINEVNNILHEFYTRIGILQHASKKNIYSKLSIRIIIKEIINVIAFKNIKTNNFKRNKKTKTFKDFCNLCQEYLENENLFLLTVSSP